MRRDRVDGKAPAQVVELVRSGRIAPPRQHQRIDQALARDRGLFAALELGIDEAEVEHRIVRDQWGVADEGEKLLAHVGEQRLVLEELGRQAVHLERAVRHLAFGVEVVVEAIAGRKPVHQLDTADLDQPVALVGVEAGGLGVEHDLAHAVVLRCLRTGAASAGPGLPDSPPRQAATARKIP